MIKEALQYIVGLGNVELHDIGRQTFSNQRLHVIEEPKAAAINVRSLSGLVDYLKSDFDQDGFEQRMVHIINPVEVNVFSTFNGDYERNQYVSANAMLPKFSFDSFYNAEDMNIKLQSAFVKNEDRDIMLQVVGNIKEEAVQTIGDDGTSQAVTAKTGVATVSTVKVPNPVVLAPYRTFVEIEQPESEFIFRMQSGPRCALFEADGGAWKIEAMARIKAYLEIELADEIKSEKVIIIA